MSLQAFTFGLAMLGFLGLAICTILCIYNRSMRSYLAATSLIIVTHVALVWIFRYEGSLATATRNGYAGFFIFHVALVLIVLSNFLTGPARSRILPVAFLIVCLGATGAVFRYDEVQIYRIPVILTALFGVIVLAGRLVRSRSPRSA